MATENEHRANLRRAVDQAAQRQGVTLTQDARAFFVNRAIEHIYNRFSAEQNRDREVSRAVESTNTLLSNLSPMVESRVVKSLNDEMVRNFARTSRNCIYPFCKPSP